MGTASDPREPLDVLAESFVEAMRHGQEPSVESYAADHPELAEQIRQLFPVLQVMEEAGAEVPSATPVFPGLEVVAELSPGVGGMGKVYRAREASLQRTVAVKTVKQQLDTEEGREWFVREARAAAALDHPNIVRVFSFHSEHDPPYYLMEFVDGRPLDIACAGRDTAFCIEVFEKAARALAYAHGNGIVHRDIKPTNILVDAKGEPHITDFGLAKRVTPRDIRMATESSSLKGTPAYIPPEVYHGDRNAGPEVDVYALGVALYGVLCRAPAFSGKNRRDIRAAVRRGRPRMPQEVVFDLPEPLQRICLKAMEPDPKDRYASADEMADDLRRFRRGQEVLARPRRYEVELRGRVRNHLSDLRAWCDQQLIGVEDKDRLSRPYRRLLGQDTLDSGPSRRLSWEMVTLSVGVWVVLLGSILWPPFYWDDLNRLERVTAVGMPALLLNLTGWLSRDRTGRVNTIVFLCAGAVLVPVFVTVLLHEYQLLNLVHSKSWEIFGADALPVVADGQSGVPAGADHFAASNFQIFTAMVCFLAYAIVILRTVRFRAFGWLVGNGVYLAYISLWLLFGMLEWIKEDQVTTAVALMLPVPLFFVWLAKRIRVRAMGAWCPEFYVFFPVPFAVLLTALAYYGATEIIMRRPGADFASEDVQLWLMASGLAYLLAASVSARSTAGFVRFWVPWFVALVSLSFLVPCNLLFDEPATFALGAERFNLYELGSALFGTVFLVLGARARIGTLALSGVVGTATFVVRFTDKHLRDVLSWPLALTLVGATAMLIGGFVAVWRTRSEQRSRAEGEDQNG